MLSSPEEFRKSAEATTTLCRMLRAQVVDLQQGARRQAAYHKLAETQLPRTEDTHPPARLAAIEARMRRKTKPLNQTPAYLGAKPVLAPESEKDKRLGRKATWLGFLKELSDLRREGTLSYEEYRLFKTKPSTQSQLMAQVNAQGDPVGEPYSVLNWPSLHHAPLEAMTHHVTRDSPQPPSTPEDHPYCITSAHLPTRPGSAPTSRATNKIIGRFDRPGSASTQKRTFLSQQLNALPAYDGTLSRLSHQKEQEKLRRKNLVDAWASRSPPSHEGDSAARNAASSHSAHVLGWMHAHDAEYTGRHDKVRWLLHTLYGESNDPFAQTELQEVMQLLDWQVIRRKAYAVSHDDAWNARKAQETLTLRARADQLGVRRYSGDGTELISAATAPKGLRLLLASSEDKVPNVGLVVQLLLSDSAAEPSIASVSAAPVSGGSQTEFRTQVVVDSQVDLTAARTAAAPTQASPADQSAEVAMKHIGAGADADAEAAEQPQAVLGATTEAGVAEAEAAVEAKTAAKAAAAAEAEAEADVQVAAKAAAGAATRAKIEPEAVAVAEAEAAAKPGLEAATGVATAAELSSGAGVEANLQGATEDSAVPHGGPEPSADSHDKAHVRHASQDSASQDLNTADRKSQAGDAKAPPKSRNKAAGAKSWLKERRRSSTAPAPDATPATSSSAEKTTPAAACTDKPGSIAADQPNAVDCPQPKAGKSLDLDAGAPSDPPSDAANKKHVNSAEAGLQAKVTSDFDTPEVQLATETDVVPDNQTETDPVEHSFATEANAPAKKGKASNWMKKKKEKK
eukprot:gene11138-301_t